MWEIQVTGRDFKWDQLPAWWTAVFIGSNDWITPEVQSQLGSLKPPVLLVSMIGGLSCFKLLPHCDVSEWVMFDRNVNEFTKFLLVYDHITSTPFEQFNGLGWLNDVVDKPDFYLPGKLLQMAKLALPETSGLPERDGMPGGSCILPGHKHQWKPNKHEYEAVQLGLQRVRKTLYINLPTLVWPGTVVVNVSNSCLPHKVIVDCISAQSLWIIYTQSEVMMMKNLMAA